MKLILLALLLLTATVSSQYFKRYISKTGLSNGPNARTISNVLGRAIGEPPKSSLNLTMIEVYFSQFITHDLGRINFNSTIIYTDVFAGDSVYGVNASNNFILQNASVGDYLEDDGKLRFQTRNFNTPALDLSQIYGSDSEISAILRENVGGRLKTSNYTVVINPFVSFTYPNMPPSKAVTGLDITTPLTNIPNLIFTSGDDRLNENIGLSLFTVAFIREHNYQALLLAAQNPNWGDEQLFNTAKLINIAQYQAIVMYEYVPSVLGSLSSSVKKYKGYDEDTDIRSSLEFTTVAFRYGHSTVAPWSLIMGNGSVYSYTIPAGIFGPFPITSSELPFSGQLGGPLNPPQVFLLSGGVENIVRGLVEGKADDSDIIFNNVVRNIQFGGLIGRAVDLFTLDIVRARNSESPSYYNLRKKFYNIRKLEEGSNIIYSSNACNANKNSPAPDPLACFSLISSNITIAGYLQSLYGKVTLIDGLVGVLAEDKYSGSLFSRTLAGILIKEYEDKRDGDSEWFENVSSLNSLSLSSTKLSHIFRRSFNLPTLRENLFTL